MIFETSLTFLSADDTVGDLKKLIAAQTGTRAERIVLKKWWVIYSFSFLLIYLYLPMSQNCQPLALAC